MPPLDATSPQEGTSILKIARKEIFDALNPSSVSIWRPILHSCNATIPFQLSVVVAFLEFDFLAVVDSDLNARDRWY